MGWHSSIRIDAGGHRPVIKLSIKTAVLLALALPCAAQIAPTWSTVSRCASRPDAIQQPPPGDGVVADSQYTITCGSRTKSDGVTELWDVYYFSGAEPADASDSGTGKLNVTAPARAAAGGPIPDDVSCGNPGTSATHILFQCQASTSSTVHPGTGNGYELWGCSAIPCTPTNAAKLLNQAIVRAFGGTWASANIAGGLDPHFYEWDADTVYWTVLEAGSPVQLWSIYTITVDWSGAAPVTAGIVSRQIPGDWAGYIGSITGCTRFYKASGASRSATGTVTMFVQADQVTWSGDVSGALPGAADDPCYVKGATYKQSGLFSYRPSDPAGSWTQIYPPAGWTPIIVNGEYNSYAEFPTPVPRTNQLLILTNHFSPRLGFIQSIEAANQHDDWALIGMDGKGLRPITNYDNPGSAMYNALSDGGLGAGAHAGINSYTRTFVTRFVSASGTKDRVLKFSLDHATSGLYPSFGVHGYFGVAGYLGIR